MPLNVWAINEYICSEKRTHRVVDAGYAFRYHRQGVDALPRIPDCKVNVPIVVISLLSCPKDRTLTSGQ